MPSLRHCSGGPPPSAIHGRGRLPRHPCRGAPCTTPAFGLWERGRQIKIKSQSQSKINNTQRSPTDRSHALRGNASRDAPRHPCAGLEPCVDSGTRSVPGGIPTQSVGTINRRTAFAFHHSTGRALARLQLLILMHRPIERPSGGSAQWATRHGWRRAHGAGPERGHAEPRRGTERQGQEPLVTWGFSK
jgi:hypothetical protein